MKKILNYVIAIITIVYIGFLCYFNLSKGFFSVADDLLINIAFYGGCAIAIVSAFINMLGMPFQSIFLIVLTILVVVFVLTLIVPDWFRNLFGMNQSSFIGFVN